MNFHCQNSMCKGQVEDNPVSLWYLLVPIRIPKPSSRPLWAGSSKIPKQNTRPQPACTPTSYLHRCSYHDCLISISLTNVLDLVTSCKPGCQLISSTYHYIPVAALFSSSLSVSVNTLVPCLLPILASSPPVLPYRLQTKI